MLENPLLINKSEYKSKVVDELLYNMLDKTFNIPKNFSYNVIEVTEDFIGRMDLISRQVYGTEKYQDVLCKLNGISNPFELNAGTLVVLPDASYISEFYFKENPADLEDENNTNINLPKAKKKTEKRKPNEAVIGDKRYKVDSTRKVIVY